MGMHVHKCAYECIGWDRKNKTVGNMLHITSSAPLDVCIFLSLSYISVIP